MNEKKYCGEAKESKYGYNGKISLNQIFEHFYNATNDKNILSAYKLLKGALSGKKYKFINEWENKESKVQLELKIQINNLKNPNQYKTHAISFNEWIPDPTKAIKSETTSHIIQEDENNDDIPF